jgi:hypothetical protein
MSKYPLLPSHGRLASGLTAVFPITNLIQNTQMCHEMDCVHIKLTLYFVAIAVDVLYKYQVLQQYLNLIGILMPNIFFSFGLLKRRLG